MQKKKKHAVLEPVLHENSESFPYELVPATSDIFNAITSVLQEGTGMAMNPKTATAAWTTFCVAMFTWTSALAGMKSLDNFSAHFIVIYTIGVRV